MKKRRLGNPEPSLLFLVDCCELAQPIEVESSIVAVVSSVLPRESTAWIVTVSPTRNIRPSMSQRLDVVVELAWVAATVRETPNLVYDISTETMSLRPAPPSSTRIELSMFIPS